MRLLQWTSLIGLCFAFVHRTHASPLDNWHFRNPLPTGNSLKSVTFGAGQFVAVGNAGTVLTSPDGSAWFQQRSMAETNLNLVGYGGGMYVAFGSNGFLQTSPDGTNWTQQRCPTSTTINAVSYGNGMFVAVGGQVTLTSTNGKDWVQHAVPLGYSYETLVSACFGNGKFLAISDRTLAMSVDGVIWTTNSLPAVGVTIAYGHNAFQLAGLTGGNPFLRAHVFSSPDGVAWTDQTDPSLIAAGYAFLATFAYDYDNMQLLLVTDQGTYASADGLNWSSASPGIPISPSYGVHITSVSYGNGSYAALQNDGLIWRSADGSNWVAQPHGSQDSLDGIASGNGIYVAVGAGNWISSGTHNVLRSADGLSYTAPNTPFTNSLISDIIFASGAFTAVGQTGLVVQSTDGISWTQRNAGSVENLNRITVGSGLLIAVGNNGRIQTSPTGRTWNGRFSGTDQPLFGVAYGKGTYVTVGYSGTVLSSYDANLWTAQDSGTLKSLSGITYGPAGFVAVGESGTIITSPDAMTWTASNQNLTNDLVSVCYGNGQYVAVGASFWANASGRVMQFPSQNPIILSSSDGVQWIRHNSGNTDVGYMGCAFANNRFLVVGGQGTILESDPVPPPPFSISGWQTLNGFFLTVYSPPSPTLRIQAATDLSSNGWSDVASFTNVSGAVQWTDTSAQAHRVYRAVSP